MGRFVYKARGPYGQVEGVQEAATTAQVAAILKSKGLIPVKISADAATAAALASNLGVGGSMVDLGGKQGIQLFAPKVERADVMLFSRQIHTLLKAGVPILRALAGLQETTTNPAMKAIILDLRRSLESGVDLATSVATHPKIFDSFYVAMIKVGEASGQIDQVFMRLYKHLDFEQFMKQQVKSALRYPSFVIMAMVGAVTVINVMVVPAFEGVFKSLGANLPVPTKILIASSNLTLNYGWWLLGGAVGAVFLFKQWIASVEGRMVWDRLLINMPLIGPIVTQAALSRFARAFSLSLRSGVPLERALTSVAQTADNKYISARIDGMREAITRGDSLTRAAVATGVFTPMVLQMLAIGEETGMLDELLDEIGEVYSSEVEYSLKTLSQQIEPILVIFLGAIVLLLALGVFMPMWEMGRATIKH
ncbi:type II secretion system F family protein [Aquabacterium sp.]|uniref:type II secretion system F family protein n=1 Tax=Aquabacterium TaxID=92793 RepID=UPI001D4D1171|nr:type II secretion system F family protein [Aquabacterium sp.]MBT9611268.1 type II secretion system F family protein [Aquabacterium sp.]